MMVDGKFREVNCCAGCHEMRFTTDVASIINQANPPLFCPHCGERHKVYVYLQVRNERKWYKPQTWLLPEWRFYDEEN